MKEHRNLPVPLNFPEQPMLIEHPLNHPHFTIDTKN